MSKRFALAVFVLVCSILQSTVADPEVAFPFNSQVPAVARAGEQYKFQFSLSTFAPSAHTFTYSLSDAPSWLHLDSATRTLSGVPTKEDAGAVQFVLTAADNTGAVAMPCTLVVSTDPAPRLEGDISAALSLSANLSSTDPAVVTLRPSTPFNFVFQPSSFIDKVPRQLYYYASLADHTPLPAWLSFDAQRLTFEGRAPELSAFPQSWDIQLIASDVVGFSATTAGFTIAVSTQQLVFVPAEQNISTLAGTALNFTTLQHQLYRNGALLPLEEIATAEAIMLPTWLHFDVGTLAVTGTVPIEHTEESFTVNIIDQAGYKAQASISLVSRDASLLVGEIGTLTAYSGQPFQYSIPETLLSSTDVTIDIRLPTQADWLDFDNASRTLHGTVPKGIAPIAVAAVLRVSSANDADSETQSFTISIRDPSAGTRSPSPASNSGDVPSTTTAGTRHLSRGAVIAVVICSLIGVAILLVLLFLCCRRRRKNVFHEDESHSAERPSISRPIASSPVQEPTSTSATIEKSATSPTLVNDGAPQIGRLSILSKRFSRMSRVSSLGPGQETIMADPNITECGGEKELLRQPHESFQAIPKMAVRSGRWSGTGARKSAHRQQQKSDDNLVMGTRFPSPRQKSGFSHSNGHKVSRADMSPRLREGSQASVNTSVLSETLSLPPHQPMVAAAFGTLPALTEGHANKRNTVRLIDGDVSESLPSGFKDKHDSYMRSYRSRRSATPVFANARGSTRQSRKPSRSHGSFSTTSFKLREHRLRESQNRLSTQRESSMGELRHSRNLQRLSSRLRSVFSPEYPKVVVVQRDSTATLQQERTATGGLSTRPLDEHRPENSQADSGDDWHTSMSSNESEARSISAMPEWLAEAQLPRHQRDWVHPFEASPTPEPPPKSHLRVSRSFHTASSRQSSLASSQGFPSSPLASAPLVAKRTTLSHPARMVSKDSLAPMRVRPRLVDASSRGATEGEDVEPRPEAAQAQSGADDAAVGSEMWLEMTMNEIRSPTSKSSTVTSHSSGRAVFL